MISETVIEAALKELFGRELFPAEPCDLYEPLRYMINIGGKRLRPRLCLTVYSLFRDSFSPEILEPAAGLEIFHTFTLIHDDVMDKSPLRRGCDTVWCKWDTDTAILSGDVMCIESYKHMAKAPAAALGRILELFSDTAARVCEGQRYDMDFEKVENVSMDDYMKMIGLKTAVLIACAAETGALAAGAPDEVCEAMYRYGYDLGLAFQVADDYLDAFGDGKVFGKPIGGDILNKKKVWMTVRAADAELTAALSEDAFTDEEKAAKISRVRGMYERLGLDRAAKEEILRLHSSAMSHAAILGRDSEEYAVLADFAERLVGRNS